MRTINTVTTIAVLLALPLASDPLAADAEPSTEDARASAGCGSRPPVLGGTSGTIAMRVGDLDREFVLHLPPGHQGNTPLSLMLDFHGYTGNAPGEEAYTGLSFHADKHGYAVVYPQGTGFVTDQGQTITSWNDLAGSASPGPEGPICSDEADKYASPPECGEPTPCNWATCHDDLAFVGAMLDQLEATLCIDLDRVYATGMSNGGMFVHRLGCDMADRFAAIAPVGGTLARGFRCAADSSTPIAMMNIYGSQDLYVSQRGDTSSDGYYYESAEAVMKTWAGSNAQDCNAETVPYETSQDGQLGLACVQHDNCSTGVEVVHCTWDGAHDWPQAEGQPVGNEIIWEFFSKHSKGGGGS